FRAAVGRTLRCKGYLGRSWLPARGERGRLDGKGVLVVDLRRMCPERGRANTVHMLWTAWGVYPLKDALTASGERISSATMAAQPRTPASSHRALGTTRNCLVAKAVHCWNTTSRTPATR